jgi:hypothetical protein
MMRVLVFLLVLVNLLFFAWARGDLGGGEPGEMQVGAQLRPEQIRIVSKDQAPPALALPTSVDSPSEPPVAPEPVREPAREEVCIVLSEVSQNDADSIERLFAEKLPAFRLSRTAMTGNPGYWVHIPPFRTRREAESKVAELRRLGVRDYFIMQEGVDSFAVSLGLFSTPGAAESAHAALREKGVRTARIIERLRKSTLSQIEFLGPRAQSGEMRRILGEALPQAKIGVCGRTAA